MVSQLVKKSFALDETHQFHYTHSQNTENSVQSKKHLFNNFFKKCGQLKLSERI